jgi:hypothetical protein
VVMVVVVVIVCGFGGGCERWLIIDKHHTKKKWKDKTRKTHMRVE